VQEANILLWFV